MILGKRGMLQGKRAVCYPSFEEYLIRAKISESERVVVDGKIITAKGMGVATELGLKLVELLCNTDTANKLRKAIIAD
jgi:4-methyl-5(b-hydroxyethyl)-thiazole monophosphate biosynthesis